FSTREPKHRVVNAKVMDGRAPVTCLSLERNKKAIWAANIRLFCRRPVRYSRTILEAMGYGQMRVLRRFFQASYLAEILLRERLTYLHAHFAHTSALVCMFAHHLTGIPYSFTAHAKDIYVERPVSFCGPRPRVPRPWSPARSTIDAIYQLRSGQRATASCIAFIMG